MRAGRILTAAMALILGVSPLLAVSPGTEVWVPAATRAAATDGFWMTDLTVINPNDTAVTVEIFWLARGDENAGAVPVSYVINPSETLHLEDVILGVFGHEEGHGAFRIAADAPVLASSYQYNATADGIFGQGLEGIPGSAAVSASGSEYAFFDTNRTLIPGLGSDDDARSNVFAVGTSPSGTDLTVEVLNGSGAIVSTQEMSLGAWEPWFASLDTLGGAGLDPATVRATVHEGSAVFVGSRVGTTGDPATMESSWNSALLPADLPIPGTLYGVVDVSDRHGSLYDFGVSMWVDINAAVYRVRFVYFGEDDCPRNFINDVELDEPIALESFFEGTATFEVDYFRGSLGTGTMSYTFDLDFHPTTPAVVGHIEATGTDFGTVQGVDYSGCNNFQMRDNVLKLGFMPRMD